MLLSVPAQPEAVRGEMEHNKLNHTFIFCLVNHNATLFSEFHKKIRHDLGRVGAHLQTNKAVLLTRREGR